MIVLLSDEHFGIKNNHKESFEEQMKFYELQFFPYKNIKIQHVISLNIKRDS